MAEFAQTEEQLQAEDGFMRYNGIHVTALGDGYCQCKARLGDGGTERYGVAHGGFVFTMCDSAAGLAAQTLGREVVTRCSAIHFLRPALTGVVTATGRVVQTGRHALMCTAELTDEKGTLLASASFDMFYYEPREPRP